MLALRMDQMLGQWQKKDERMMKSGPAGGGFGKRVRVGCGRDGHLWMLAMGPAWGRSFQSLGFALFHVKRAGDDEQEINRWKKE